ncbi:EAL domain-containing protein, partial [Sulfurovum sp. bin170]|uniref:EAL domain-containing protein n=1 Tax=Sulfurovum sp. bin170 TaxID=2695268 RepID=UPI0013DFF3D8
IIASISILFILLIFPSHTLFLNHYEKNNTYKQQLIGLEYIKIIHKIIQTIQVHRADTNAYLSSHKDIIDDIIDEEELLYLKTESLFEYDSKNLNILSSNQNLAKAISQFELIKIDKIKKDSSSKIIFKEHNDVIKLLQETILDISDKTLFSISKDLRVNYLSDMLQDKLLNIYEHSGQLQGLSSAVLTQKSMIHEQKKILYALSTELVSLKSDLIDNNILTKLSNYQALQKQTTNVADKLKKILTIIDNDIILQHNFTYDVKSFSKEVTLAMHTQEELYKMFIYTYKDTIEELQSNSKKELRYLILGFLIILLISLYIFIAFYQSITGNLKKLQTASELIAEGQTDIHLDVHKKDEIGDALLAFNTMSDKLNKNISFLDGYKTAIDKSSIVSKTDLRGIITYANQMFCNVSGYTQEELIGSSHNIVRHPDVPKSAFRDMWNTIQSKKVWKGIVKNKKKDGSYYIVNATVIPILDNKGEIREYVAVRHDITELEDNKDEIKKQRIDLLTSLPNRNQLLEDLKTAIKPIIFYLNIDDFSGFNDFYGRTISDNTLVRLAHILSDIDEKNRYRLYKLEADQFILLFEEGYLSRDNLQYFFEECILDIETKISNPGPENQNRISVSMTGGAATYYVNEDYQKLILYSNIARKKAQQEHKKFLLFHHSMRKSEDYAHNIEWIKRVKEAINEDRIVCYYQPIFDNRTQKLEKYESLVRLIDKDGQAISPFFFLEIAKKAKLYEQITHIVIDKTFDRFRDLPTDFSINLTIDDILSERTTNYIYQKLESYPNTHRVIFEITESQDAGDYKLINKFIKYVKQYSVKIAIDDFGSGYANFEHILNIDADFIKIDGSLIKNIHTDENSYIITE